MWRWPVAECLHVNRSMGFIIRELSGAGRILVPSQCLDCGLVFDD